MTGICPSCGCGQPDGLLCHDDSAALEVMLAAAPQLIEQLDLAIAKQARVSKGNYAGSPERPKSADDELGNSNLKHERSPVNWGVVAVRDALMVELAFIGEDINWVRRHPQVAEMVRDFGKAVANAYRAIDRARDREYLGTCFYEEDGAVCHAEVWVKPKERTVRCTQCEHVYDVAERREWLLDQAEDRIVTPREAVQYVGDVGGMSVGYQRIRNYVDRKRIVSRPSPDGVMRFRLGDLLAVLRSDAARHDVRAS